VKKRILALLLILAFSAGVLMVNASGQSLGGNLELENVQYYIDQSPENENFYVYTPNSVIRPTVVYGSKVCNYGKFSAMAELLQSQGFNVVGGINAGFFNTPSYQPLGIVVSDGILRSSDEAGYHSIGFRTDGMAFIGDTNMTLNISFNGLTFPLNGYNKSRTRAGFTLLSGEFFKDTQNTEPGRDFILVPLWNDDGIKVDGEYEFLISDIIESESALALTDDMYVLTLNAAAEASLQVAADGLSVGDIVTFAVHSDPIWLEADSAIGSYIKLVSNGTIDAEYSKTPKAEETHPRTAVGIKADGSVIFYTVDGRQHGISDGMTGHQVAQRMLELGCVDALMLDGGGSTDFYTRQVGSDTLTMLSHPSDLAKSDGGGIERSVSTYIMLAAFEQGSGVAGQLALYPEQAIVLKGSEFSFSLKAADETLRPVELPDVPIAINPTELDNTYTATAEYNALTASATLKEIVTPDKIELLQNGNVASFISARPNATYSIDAQAYYNGSIIFSTDKAYTWSITPELGVVDAEGNVTITAKEGNGILSAAAGEMTVEIPIAIERRIQTLESFESDAHIQDAAAALITLESNKDYVHNGNYSAKIAYDLNGADSDVIAPYIPLPLDVEPDMKYISMWVYVPSSSDVIALGFDFEGNQNVGGGLSSVRDDWQLISLPIPSDGADIVALILSCSENGSGEIWIDHIIASDEPTPDNNPPTISGLTFDSELTLLTASLSDNGGRLKKDNIKVTADGKSAAFTFNPLSGELSATLSGATHISVTAEDYSGNLMRESLTLPPPEDSTAAFPDINGHWAYDYVNYMSNRGVVTGFEQPDGTFLYKPNSEITRAQFAVMLYRFMNADAADISIDYLNRFDDINDIPEWAANAVAWAVSSGYINGVGNDDGTLNFRPNSTLSRAQAMTILGRIQPQGYAPADLTEFTDYADVPMWSEKYIASLVGQGVINGRDGGKLAPYGALTRAEVAKILTLVG